MSTLYHYCSVESFFNILKSKKVWLCDARHMNDHMEIAWTSHLVEVACSALRKEENAADLMYLLQHVHINRLHPFIFCLSTEGDLLSQWRAYASDGAGVAIGFNKDAFPRARGLPARNVGPGEIALYPVIYNKADQQRNVNFLVNSYLDRCLKGERAEAAGDVGYPLAAFGTYFKNPAFEEEAEVRLVHTPSFITDANNMHQLMGSEMEARQRCTSTDIYTYFEYAFPGMEPTTPLVNEIVLGPTCKLSNFDLELFLSLNGLWLGKGATVHGLVSDEVSQMRVATILRLIAFKRKIFGIESASAKFDTRPSCDCCHP